MAEEKIECKNNLYPIEGIIYAKPVRTANGKVGTVNAGKVFEFPSIVLEVKREYNSTTYTELPEFELGKGINLENFDIGDRVMITFSLGGKIIQSKGRPDWHKTTLKALFIKHAGVDYNDTTATGPTFQKKDKKDDDVFAPSNPLIDDLPEEDLPF